MRKLALPARLRDSRQPEETEFRESIINPYDGSTCSSGPIYTLAVRLPDVGGNFDSAMSHFVVPPPLRQPPPPPVMELKYNFPESACDEAKGIGESHRIDKCARIKERLCAQITICSQSGAARLRLAITIWWSSFQQL